jgi:hypothetical protein
VTLDLAGPNLAVKRKPDESTICGTLTSKPLSGQLANKGIAIITRSFQFRFAIETGGIGITIGADVVRRTEWKKANPAPRP